MMLSPSLQSAFICGEANIGRYMARLMPGLGYENDHQTPARLDNFLDLTDPGAGLGANGSKRDRPVALNLLENSLAAGGQALAGGAQIGWVDAVLYSAVVNAKIADKDLGSHTRKWMQRCHATIKVVN